MADTILFSVLTVDKKMEESVVRFFPRFAEEKKQQNSDMIKAMVILIRVNRMLQAIFLVRIDHRKYNQNKKFLLRLSQEMFLD